MLEALKPTALASVEDMKLEHQTFQAIVRKHKNRMKCLPLTLLALSRLNLTISLCTQFKFRSILADQRRRKFDDDGGGGGGGGGGDGGRGRKKDLRLVLGPGEVVEEESAAFHSIMLLSKILKREPDVVVPNFQDLASNIQKFYEEVPSE